MSTSVDVFYFLSGQGQYTVHIFSMERQKALGLGLNILNCVPTMNEGES